MPQLVALFNGVGGGAAAIVALVELVHVLERLPVNDIIDAERPSLFMMVTIAFTIVVGSVSFAGSIVTFLKLQELMTTRPVVFAGYPILYGLGLLAAVGFSIGWCSSRACPWACCWPSSARASGCCWSSRWGVRTYRSSSRC